MPPQIGIAPLPYTELGWQRQQNDCWTAPLPAPHEVSDPGEYVAMQRLWHPSMGRPPTRIGGHWVGYG